MNENEFDLTARAWLDDGPTRISDRALQSALEEVHTTRQRRAVRPAWKAPPVRMFGGVAIAAVLVVAVGYLAINVLRPTDGPSVGGPSPSPSAAQTGDFPDLTTTFVSPRNGYSIKHPDGVTLTPATQLLGFGPNRLTDGLDVVDTGLSAVLAGTSGRFPNREFLELPNEASINAWVDDQFADYGGCSVPRSQQAEITIDGQAGRIAECPNEIEATVVANGRVYLFALSHDRSDARAVFDAFAATIDLTPETAIDYPALTTNFVSPTYGFSFDYFDRGGLTPATERWDPVNKIGRYLTDPPFDTVETGLSAQFHAASVELPDGVSIDAWVDEYLMPVAAGGCGVPRSRQAEITIDGQSGRFAACQNGLQATVVVGGRLYLFILSVGRTDARAFFDAWVATIDLRPEDAATPSPAP